MTFKQKIQEDFKKALKEKRKIEISTLRMLQASILNEEKKKRYQISKKKPNLKEKELQKESQLSDDEIQEVVFSEAKKRKESISEFDKGGRQDLVEKEKAEMEVLKRYLPEQLSEEEIKKLAKETIEKIGAETMKDMGRVMGQLMPKLKGNADGSLVSKIAKELLTKETE